MSSADARKTPRKPPAKVRTITGETPEADAITDDDYQRAVDAQDNTLFAQGLERKILGQIRTRLVMGARDAGTRYYFDAQRGIVRRREPKESAS